MAVTLEDVNASAFFTVYITSAGTPEPQIRISKVLCKQASQTTATESLSVPKICKKIKLPTARSDYPGSRTQTFPFHILIDKIKAVTFEVNLPIAFRL